jgi:hypothetical protein
MDRLPDDIPDPADGACCMGALMHGPTGCTCWVTVYDLEQADPLPGLPVPPVPLRMCEPGPGDAGCAYRGTSPEKTGDDRYNGDAEDLDYLAGTGQPFYCHAGTRRAVRLVHPAGVTYEPGPGDYQPPVIGGVPYRADGRPALICAGWLLRRAVLLRQADLTEGAA